MPKLLSKAEALERLENGGELHGNPNGDDSPCIVERHRLATVIHPLEVTDFQSILSDEAMTRIDEEASTGICRYVLAS